MPPKAATVRRGGYKCRTLEMYLQLRNQQLKTNLYVFRLLYQNFRVTANQKSTIDIQIRNINSNTTLNIVIKPQEKRTKGKKKGQEIKGQRKSTKTNPKQLTKGQ